FSGQKSWIPSPRLIDRARNPAFQTAPPEEEANALEGSQPIEIFNRTPMAVFCKKSNTAGMFSSAGLFLVDIAVKGSGMSLRERPLLPWNNALKSLSRNRHASGRALSRPLPTV